MMPPKWLLDNVLVYVMLANPLLHNVLLASRRSHVDAYAYKWDRQTLAPLLRFPRRLGLLVSALSRVLASTRKAPSRRFIVFPLAEESQLFS